MISPINILIAFLWGLSAFLDYADFCHLWQLKEYRLDRFRDFLSTDRGKRFLLRYSLFWRSLVVIVIFLWPINEIITVKYLLLLIFSFDLIYNLYRLLLHKLRYPVPTKKALLIILLSLLFEGGLFILMKDWTLPLMFMIVRFFTLALFVLLVNKVADLVKAYIIKNATIKMKNFPYLAVVGITGSYGKTTTKTFLQHILENKFRTIMTPRHINTEIGVAKFILQTDFSDFDIFVVEMGAYSLGEIKKICDIVKPKIGILTAINEQHLSLFGDLKTTQQTKYELLRSLPKDGLAIVNADNPLCTEFLGELDCGINTFGMEEENNPTFLIKDVRKTEKGIFCVGFMDNEQGEVEVPIVGEHNFMNIAPCLLVGRFLGMKREEMRERCRSLQLPERSLQLYDYGNCIILDDSYNSNPNGFRAALEVMRHFPSEYHRVVVTRGMLELGSKSAEIHRQMGEEISMMAEELIIITKDYANPLVEGVGKKFNTKVTLLYDSKKLLEYLKSFKEKKAILLLENRLPGNVLLELTGKKEL